MDTEEVKRRWREKNARTTRAAPVEIDGVGTVYVRLMTVGDSTAVDALAKGGEDVYPTLMATMLCDENGARLSKEEIEEFEAIFREGALWSDYLKMRQVATGAEIPN